MISIIWLGFESSFSCTIALKLLRSQCNRKHILSNRRLFDTRAQTKKKMYKTYTQAIRSHHHHQHHSAIKTWNDKWKQNFIKKNWEINLKTRCGNEGFADFFSSSFASLLYYSVDKNSLRVCILHTEKMRSIKSGGIFGLHSPGFFFHS